MLGHSLELTRCAPTQPTKEFKTALNLDFQDSSKIRAIVARHTAVTIIVRMQTPATNTVLSFLAVLAGDMEMQKQRTSTMLAIMKGIVMEILMYYQEVIRFIWYIVTTQDGGF